MVLCIFMQKFWKGELLKVMVGGVPVFGLSFSKFVVPQDNS